MSDDSSGETTDATPDDAATPAASPTDTNTPAPRPRSAASRARRIGGAAASPRPGTGSSEKPAEKAVDTTKKAVPAGKETRTSEKAAKPGKSARPAAKASTTDDELGSRSRQVTVSLPGWARWAPSVAFAAVAVVFLTLFAVARIGGDDAPATTSSTMRDKVLASAKTCLAALNTYRYTALDAAEAAGVKCTTGKLTSDYKKTVSTVIRKNAPPLKAVQLCKINTAGIEAVTRDGKQWTVLAYGQLNITTANLKQGRIDPFAVVARLEQVKGKWVLSKIDTVSSVA